MGKSNLVYNVTNLGFRHEGGTGDHFKDINLEIYSGEKVAIIGPNGSGKSTLLNLLAGFAIPAKGRIEFLGSEFSERTLRERAQLFTYLPQFGKNTGIDLRVFEFIEMGLFSEQGRFEHLSPTQTDRIKSALAMFDLTAFQERKIATLSGGEYQRARLARSFVRSPDIYLLDEPSAALDVRFQLKLWQKIHGLEDGNESTIIAAVHDIDIATRVFDRVLVLDKNGVLVADTKEMTTTILEEAFGVGVKKLTFDDTVHWFFNAG